MKSSKLEKESKTLFEAIGIILIGVSLFFIVSLVTYTPSDTKWATTHPNLPPKNYAGIVGAYLSQGLFGLFGGGAYVLPIILALIGVASTMGKMGKVHLLKGIGIILLIISCSTLFSLPATTSFEVTKAGGIIGASIAPRLKQLFNFGAYLIVIISFILGFIFFTELSISTAMREIKKGAKALINKISTERSARKVKKRPMVSVSLEKRTSLEERGAITPSYQLPPLSLLQDPPKWTEKGIKEDLLTTSNLLEDTLRQFGITARVVNVNRGPVVTSFEVKPERGVKVSSIVNLSNDIALALAAKAVRIEAPIPGKQAIGIEIPNKKPSIVYLKEIIESPTFQENVSLLTVALGKDITGAPYIMDLSRAPHLLISGTTGSGKSVCISSIIASILYNATPRDVKFLLIDPKRVELTVFSGMPNLVTEVVTDVKQAKHALIWLVQEMEKRYRVFADYGVRDIENYRKLKEKGEEFPYIVMIIDELADLMLSSPQDCENAIIRLAQMSRAVGIHLVLATQRPSVDIITGLIKANFPSRIAFQVSSRVDSRTILDMNGAEKLLGKGDMLFIPPDEAKPVRIQGSYISPKEIEEIVRFIKQQGIQDIPEEKYEVFKPEVIEVEEEKDELFEKALEIASRSRKISTSMLQRRLRIGYNRAARIIELMEGKGIVSQQIGSKPRKVLIGKDDL
ncbi:MAG: DNA translocase FtsK [bacterium]|nr:DNA translocase FtsK [bacterium]